MLLVRKAHFENHWFATVTLIPVFTEMTWETNKQTNSNARTLPPKYFVSVDLGWSSDVGTF